MAPHRGRLPPSPHHRDPKPDSFCRLNCQGPAPKVCLGSPEHQQCGSPHDSTGAVGSGPLSRGALGDQGALEMSVSSPRGPAGVPKGRADPAPHHQLRAAFIPQPAAIDPSCFQILSASHHGRQTFTFKPTPISPPQITGLSNTPLAQGKGLFPGSPQETSPCKHLA